MLLALFDDTIADAAAADAAGALAECRMMDVLAAAALNCDACGALVMDDDKGRGLLPPTDIRAKLDVTSGGIMADWLDRCPPPT